MIRATTTHTLTKKEIQRDELRDARSSCAAIISLYSYFCYFHFIHIHLDGSLCGFVFLIQYFYIYVHSLSLSLCSASFCLWIALFFPFSLAWLLQVLRWHFVCVFLRVIVSGCILWNGCYEPIDGLWSGHSTSTSL